MNSAPEADRELVITRVLDAPPAVVFAAWTAPEQVAHWFGPHGFTLTIQEMDVRPGGVWRFVMHGPDGTDYPNRIVYQEVVPPERLVYLHGPTDKTAELMHVTITFTERDGRTELTSRMRFATPEERDRMVETAGALEGIQQTLARLGEYLAAPAR
jgi:uncharacterized protein YndB with AHSA1/START domain